MSREIEPVFDKTVLAKVHRLRIDPEFKNLLGVSSEKDRIALADSLSESGCLTPLVAWPQPEGDAILLDGHRRYEICEKWGMAYRVVECPDHISDRQSALIWIIRNQRARRNITQYRLAYLRGKIYLAEKKNDLANLRQNRPEATPGGKNYHPGTCQKTAERLAEEFNVSEKTIRNNAKFAEAIDSIAAEHGQEAGEDILDGRKNLSDYAPQPEPSLEEDTPPEPEAEPSTVVETSSEPDPEPPAEEEASATSALPEAAPSEPEADEEAPSASALSESDPLHGWEKMSESEHVQWMTKNLKPNGDSGLRPGPVYFGDTVSENLADPEALRRHEASFMKHLCQIEYHISQLPAAVERDAPDAERGEMLENRLARQVDALQTLIETLKNRRKPC